jgi:cyclase
MDVRRSGARHEVFTHNGSKATGLDPAGFARRAEELGAGEVVVNSIDRDGVMKGYDLDLLTQVRNAVTLPLTALGGAGSLKDIADLIRKFGIVGAAAGSLFVFKGVYRAVLINYPSRAERDSLLQG